MRALIALLLSLWLAPAWAQVPMTGAGAGTPTSGAPMVSAIFSSMEAAPSTSATHYVAINGGTSTTATGSRETVSPISGTVGNMRVDVGQTLAAGSYAFTLLVGGSATGVTCTVTARTCSDTTHTASVTAGQTLAWQIVPSGTPTALNAGAWTISSTFTSTTNGQGLILAAANATNPSTTAKNYGQIDGPVNWNATEASSSSLIPTSGTIDGLQVILTTAPGSGAGWTFTVFKNGSATSLSCSISGAVTRTCSDAIGGGHAVSVTATDTVSVEACPYNTAGCTAGSAPAASGAKYSVAWIPTTPGEAIYMVTSSALNNSATRYSGLLGASSITGPSTTEANTLELAPVALTWKKLYALINGTGLSGSMTRTFNSRIGASGAGQSNGSVTCQMNSGSPLSCNDTTHTQSVSAADLMNWSAVPTNTPPSNLTWYKLGTIVTIP